MTYVDVFGPENAHSGPMKTVWTTILGGDHDERSRFAQILVNASENGGPGKSKTNVNYVVFDEREQNLIKLSERT